MKLEMTDDDHRKLDVLIEKILDAYKDGEVTPGQAREVLAHLICAGAVRDEPFVIRDWLRSETFDRWKEKCRAART